MTYYYSFIQYCPDRSRHEAVNIGIAIYIVETGRVIVSMSKNNKRVKRLFGRKSLGNRWLTEAKNMFANRLNAEKFSTLAEFKLFVDTRANELVMTPPTQVRLNSIQEMDEFIIKMGF